VDFFNGQDAGDKNFLTCKALHNWLLEVDGLDKKWDEGIPTAWEGALGCHDLHNVEENLPEAITCLMSPGAMRAYDVSGMGFIEDEPLQDNLLTFNESHLTRLERQYEHKGKLSVRVVIDLQLYHFDIAFQRNNIVWPGRRNHQMQPVI
jgi:hypothetical protein